MESQQHLQPTTIQQQWLWRPKNEPSFSLYALAKKHAIILCHLIAIKILKNKNKFECYQAGLESHH